LGTENGREIRSKHSLLEICKRPDLAAQVNARELARRLK
jgi:hypothetical protein